VTHRYAGYNTETPSYSEAQTVADDTIFEQTDSLYDKASNIIKEFRRERFHNTSGDGELGGPSGTPPPPNARVLYLMSYPDALGRIVATANYGTNGGSEPARSETIPARSDSVLVTSFEFNERGELVRTIDPKETVTVREFDDAGRLVKTIENYQV
jgi:hypothetical protein